MNFSLQDKPCSNQVADSRFPTAVISHFYSAVYVPYKPKTFKSSDKQRWAVNYLRHECSSYKEAYEQLQDEVWELLDPDIPQADYEGAYVVSELVHCTIKNRIQEKIAAQFPELADAAGEQML